MAWNFNRYTPVYLQIVERIRNDIINGKFKPNEQIPTVRQLAINAAVNPNTVQRALTELENEDLLYSQGTLGRFVTDNEDVILKARKNEAKKFAKSIMKHSKYLGISKDELIEMLEEETEE